MRDKSDVESSAEKDEPEKKVHRLEKVIEDSTKDYEQTTSEISSQIGKKEEEISSELKEANAELAKIKQNLNESSSQLRGYTNNCLRWISQKLEDFETACYVIAVFFGVAYIGYLLWLKTPITLEILSPLGVAVVLTVLIGFSARITKRRLSDGGYTINHYLTEITAAISSIAGRKLRSHESFEGIDQGLRSATTLVKRLLTATKEFNPALKAVYDQATFQFRLADFIHTLSNALGFYGLKLDAESAKWLSSFQSMSNTENEWLADVSKPLSKKLDTSPLIISLLYYAYVDNTEGMRNVWQKVRADADVLSKLSKIMLTTSSGNYIDLSNPKLVEVSLAFLQTMESFNPRRFDELLRNFYVNLQMLKESVRQALVHFAFKLDSLQEQAVSGFIPSDTDPGNWKDEFLENVSLRLHLSKELVALLAEEYLGDVAEAQKIFAKIRQSEAKTNELLNVLIANGIVKIPERYAASRRSVLQILLNLISKRDFLSIEDIRGELDLYFNQLDNDKQRLLEALAAHNVKIPETLRRRFEGSFLPPEVSIHNLIDFLAQDLDIKNEFITLFYYEFTQDAALLRRSFIEIQRKSIRDLAELLVELKLIEFTKDAQLETEIRNLMAVLMSFQTFNIFSIQSRYQWYRNLFTWSANLCGFCVEYELAKPGFEIDFPWLLKQFGGAPMSSYEQLQVVCREILSKSDLQPKSDDVIHSATLATMVIFFKSQEDTRLPQSCSDATVNDLATKILYQFLRQREEAQLKRQRVSLKTIIESVVTNAVTDFAWIEDFRLELTHGLVRERISDIATVRFEGHLKDINELKKQKEEVSEVLRDLQSSVHEFFKAELNEDVIVKLLQMQVISAYMVTTSSQKPVISEIIETWMPRVCEEDNELSGFLMMEKGAGRYTRLGIVPVDMSFEDFSLKFNEIFQLAVQKHEESIGQVENRAEFSANIIRIFPVEATFKMVTGDATGSITIEHPARTIRDLFLAGVSDEANLALMATARVNEPRKLALKNVVVSILNGHTNLRLLLGEGIEPLVGSRRQLREAFENGTFDKELLSRMECRNLSELAQKVYTVGSAAGGEQRVTQKIALDLSGILKMLQSRMSSEERHALAKQIYERLHKIGRVLTVAQ